MGLPFPRGVCGDDLIRALEQVGYERTRQTGSHVRMTTARNGGHNVSVPRHYELKLGLFAAIVRDVATHLGVDREEILKHLR